VMAISWSNSGRKAWFIGMGDSPFGVEAE